VLALGSVGVFVVFLDATIVNVAFQTIGAALHTTAGHLAWVLNAYSLVFAAALIPAGRLADSHGHKRMFMVGAAGFALTSALCGLAPTTGVLIASRMLQALFGALIVPTSLALILPQFPLARRSVAVSTYGAMGAAAAAAGPTLGALLTEYTSWRWVFLINVPICAIVLLIGPKLLTEQRESKAARLPDPFEVLLVAAVPAALSYAIIEGPSRGWTDSWVLAGFALAVVLLPVFFWRARTSDRPVVDLSLFKVREYTLNNIGTLVFATSFYAMLLGNVIFLQTVWHYSVLQAALAISPSPIVTALVARPAGKLAGRIGYRPVLIIGALTYGLGLAFYPLFVGPDPQWLTHWLPTAFLTGIGIGMTLPVQSGAASHALPPSRYAVGAAVNSSFRQLGAVLGVSILVAILGSTRDVTVYDRAWWFLAASGAGSALVWLVPKARVVTEAG
jgi:EmrB/QacA subfamily drug resistance transporter